MLTKACWILLLLGGAFALEFTLFEGKQADPCNKFLSPGVRGRTDCPPHSQWPAPSVTILIPSSNSASNTALTPVGAALLATSLTIFGNQFPTGTGHFLALATTEDTCTLLDNNFVRIRASNDDAVGSATSAVSPSMTNSRIVFRMDGGAAGGGPNIVGPAVFSATSAWNSLILLIEDRPRMLCWSPDNRVFRYTGFKIGVAWNCDLVNPITGTTCGNGAVLSDPGATGVFTTLTPLQRQLMLQRTTCCKTSSAFPGATIRGGQCVNPGVQDCCGGAAIEIAQEKCCSTQRETVAQIDGLCPCSLITDCPIGEQCCLPTKYADLNTIYQVQPQIGQVGFPTNVPQPGFFRGECYRPTKMHCCDTGSVFDPGSAQCCRINGIQSLNVPCPCNLDSDCVTQELPMMTRTVNNTCCARSLPTPFESATLSDPVTGNDLRMCSIFSNYPTGQGYAEVQRCAGNCMDPRYQVCCNGAICLEAYEKCCNSSCCNEWTSTCFSSLRAGAVGNRFNYWNFGPANGLTANSAPEINEVCSEIETITTIKGFWIFVLPSMLLLASHVGLALVLVFAAKATPRSFSKLEFVMMGLALLTAYLAMPLYFAPVWKYGIWVIFAQLLVFLTASARIRWLNILCIIIQAITLVYLFDPFHGNAFLTLSSNRVWNFVSAPDDVMTSGVLHAIVRSWHSVDLTNAQEYCSNFYDYFKFDAQMRDFDRFDDPQITMFGYCSRGWVTALLIFSYFVMMGVLIQMILCLVAVFLRFRKEISYEIEEEFEAPYYQ